MKKTTSTLMILGAMLLTSLGINAQTTYDVSILTTSQPLTTGDYTITGTNAGSSIATAVFTVATGNTVNITLDNVNFTTTNTAATSLISLASGSSATIILKGTNVFDGQTLTASSNGISLAGSGVFTISEYAGGGSFRMKVNAATTQFQTIGYNPTGSTGHLTINNGTFINENTGTGVASACRVIAAGGSGIATVDIKGGTFQTVGSTHAGSVLYANTTATVLATTWNITGGTFTGVKGNVLGVQGGKIINYVISGASSFSNDGSKILFDKSTAGSISIQAPSSSDLQINNNGTITTVAAGTTDAAVIGNYNNSVIITSNGTPTGVANSEVSSVYKSNGLLLGLTAGDLVSVYSASGAQLLKAKAISDRMVIPSGLTIIRVTTAERVIVLK